MFRVAQAKVFRAGYEKTPFFHKYCELLADYEDRVGKGEENPFHRGDFDAKEGEYKLLLHAVACARVFYELLGRDPCRFDELVEFLVRGYFPRHLALCGAARALKEFHS